MNISSDIFNIPIINNVIIYEKTDSTNTLAKSFIKNDCVDGTLIIAKEQTAGRGRIGRSFSSPKGEGLYMSLILKPDMPLSLISQITLPIALAVANSIKKICTLPAQIKWPNDIVINQKKLVGILTELKDEYVIIGIGINVNNSSFPEEITATATSIYKETMVKYDFYTLIYEIFKHFNDYYFKMQKNKNLTFMQTEYNEALISLNQEVYIIPNKQSMSHKNPFLLSTDDLEPHICKGISPDGSLICQRKNGELIYVNSGEVSLRGINGYAK